MERKIYVLLVLIMLLFSGCAKEGSDLNILGPEGDDFSGLTVYISEMIRNDTMPTTQKLNSNKVPEGVYFLRRLNEIVHDLGFKITFESIPMEWPISKDWDGDYLEDSYAYKLTYLPYIPKLLKKDTAILFPQYNPNTADIAYILTHSKSPVVREIDPLLWKQYAPQWYAFNQDYIENYPTAIPTGYQNIPLDRPVLILRDELAKEYDKAVSSLDDLETFLKWMQEQHPELDAPMIPLGLEPSVYDLTDSSVRMGYQETALALLSCSLTGYPFDVTLQSELGLMLAISEEQAKFLPVEQDPNFYDAIMRLLSWRDQGLVSFADMKLNIPKWDKVSAAVLMTSCWTDNGIYYLNETGGQAALDFLNQTPYILFDGELPDLRAQRGEYVQNASYLGVNASDEAVEEWLSLLEYLHANRENLRSLVLGEEGVEYTLEDGVYEALSYPWPDQLKEPDQYDFRTDFKALNYFEDARYPDLITGRLDEIYSENGFAQIRAAMKLVDTRKMQQALDDLIIPDSLQTEIARRLSRAGHAQLLNGEAPQDFISAHARRLTAFDSFFKELLSLPAGEVEEFIKDFAEAQKEDAETLTQFYAEALRLADWQAARE